MIDGQNRRVGKKRDGTLEQGFLYQGQLNPVVELDGNSHVIARFVYGDRKNVPAYMIKNNTNYRIVSDHLGSVRLVVNSQTGEVAQRLDYDAWGNVTNDTNPGFQPFGYADGLYDRDTGLTRFGARDFDLEIGRWITKDLIGFEGGLNPYEFSGNSPVIYTDPSGLVYGLDGNSPYSQYHTVNRSGGGSSSFAEGFLYYFDSLSLQGNPYEVGSCEYHKRLGALEAASAVTEAARSSATVREAMLKKLAEKIQSDPAYFLGRMTGNTLVSFLAGRYSGSKGAGAVAGSGGFSNATYMFLVKAIEDEMPGCPNAD